LKLLGGLCRHPQKLRWAVHRDPVWSA
jgi:hypothetical protein